MSVTKPPKELWANLLAALNNPKSNKSNWAKKNVIPAVNDLKMAATDEALFFVVKVEKDGLKVAGAAQVEAALKQKKQELAKAEKELKEMMNKIEAVKAKKLAPNSKSDDSQELSSFLSTIGKSVVASQESLDDESIKYLTRLKENDLHGSIIPPAVFRIPKLKASLKLGIESYKKKKLNVLIFGKEEESKMINQQSVEMEITAVPASAELLQNLEGKTPQIQFVLNRSERDFLFQNIKTAVASEPENIKKGHYGDMLEPKNKNRVIFWRTTKRKPTDPDVFLVPYAGKVKVDKSRNVGLWQLKLFKNKSPVIEAIIRYDLAPNAEITKQNQGLLHNIISILAERQEALLKD